MATRMTTLLYGDKPEADVEPGNRVDTANIGPMIVSPPPMRPQLGRPFALRGIVLGLTAASAVLAGVTLATVGLVWSRSITPGAQVALVVIGVLLTSGGIAYAMSAPHDAQ